MTTPTVHRAALLLVLETFSAAADWQLPHPPTPCTPSIHERYPCAAAQVGADLTSLLHTLRKPLRCIWISQESRIWTDELVDTSQFSFTPLVLVSASLPNARERRQLTLADTGACAPAPSTIGTGKACALALDLALCPGSHMGTWDYGASPLSSLAHVAG